MTEHIAVPVPSMSAETVLKTLAEDLPGTLEDALASADAHREALMIAFSRRWNAALQIHEVLRERKRHRSRRRRAESWS